MVLTSFFDFIQAPSMRISLILHLNFAHIKPQQPNPVILVTILDLVDWHAEYSRTESAVDWLK